MVRVQSIYPRPKFNNFSRATVPLKITHSLLHYSRFRQLYQPTSTGTCLYPPIFVAVAIILLMWSHMIHPIHRLAVNQRWFKVTKRTDTEDFSEGKKILTFSSLALSTIVPWIIKGWITSSTHLASCLAFTLAEREANWVPLPGEESRICWEFPSGLSTQKNKLLKIRILVKKFK